MKVALPRPPLPYAGAFHATCVMMGCAAEASLLAPAAVFDETRNVIRSLDADDHLLAVVAAGPIEDKRAASASPAASRTVSATTSPPASSRASAS